jgi:mRNA-degrading endonuclease RelE of RelBE toxin-antitoxin system
MTYNIIYGPLFEKSINKLKKKDPPLYERARKKVGEIIDNPQHFKPLKGGDAGKRRAHIGSFVIKYTVRGNLIKLLKFEHHDRAY